MDVDYTGKLPRHVEAVKSVLYEQCQSAVDEGLPV